jgi:hypothetical protein
MIQALLAHVGDEGESMPRWGSAQRQVTRCNHSSKSFRLLRDYFF